MQKSGIPDGVVRLRRHYHVTDGTRKGELIGIWRVVPSNLEDVLTPLMIIGQAAWSERFTGGDTRERQILERNFNPFDRSEEGARTRFRTKQRDHLAKGGVIDLATLGGGAQTEAVGFVAHRPIFNFLGKGIFRLTRYESRTLTVAAYLANINVLPKEQNQGIGTALIDSMLSTYPSDAEFKTDVMGRDPNYFSEFLVDLGMEMDPDIHLKAVRIDEGRRSRLEIPQQRYLGQVAVVAEALSSRVVPA